MLTSIKSFIRHFLIGTVIYVTFVAGGTYFIQKSLVVVKHYGPYIHWAVILVALPIIAGVIHRFARINYPMLNVMCGTLISSTLLYPQYKKLWAVPPAPTDIIIYMLIVFGIGFIATQPIKATFMMAFHLGRYSIRQISTGSKPPTKSSKPNNNRTSANHTQPIYSNHGQGLALLELAIGVCSLALSVFSIFFLGQG